MSENPEERFSFLYGQNKRLLILLAGGMAVIYFTVITLFFTRGDAWLFSLLIFSEVFHLWQAITFLYTVWDTKLIAKSSSKYHVPVDIFITVAGEPVGIVERTAKAAIEMDYIGHQVYLLNDGKVAKKENWPAIEQLAIKLGISCITREIPGGAKAGNINNALRQTSAPLVVIFDADHVPHPDFLKKTIGYFADSKMGFIQTPQYYANFMTNQVTQAAWEQQQLFFGPLCQGKNRLGSVFMCGTNMVLRRAAVVEAGGMCETNIAEDFLTSLFIHERGWKSAYIPEVLAEGLAPEDFLSYYKQQFRWARGSLEVIFRYNPLLRSGLSLAQRIQYLASASYYLSGFVVLINAAMPLIFFYTGRVPFQISTMNLAAVFLPYIFLNLYILQISSNFTFTFRALSFSVSSFWLQIRAVVAVLSREKTAFAVTSKTAVQGNFLAYVTPHLLYFALTLVGLGLATWREGISAALVTNLAWSLLNCVIFSQFVAAAAPQSQKK